MLLNLTLNGKGIVQKRCVCMFLDAVHQHTHCQPFGYYTVIEEYMRGKQVWLREEQKKQPVIFCFSRAWPFPSVARFHFNRKILRDPKPKYWLQ